MISFKTREPFEQFFSSSALHKLLVLIFCSSEGNYFAAENEYNAVDMNISIADDEATLTMVDDPFLSVCEIQCFLDRCYKRKYTSDHINVYELLVQQDTRIFKNVFNNTIHPLRAIMPKKKLTKYNLRKETSHHPKINTDRFKNTFVNRLIFKHNLVL